MKLDFIKDELKSHVGDFVKVGAKAATVIWLKDKALPAIKEVAEAYTTALRESSEKEIGWCKFRDRVFLPCVVDGALGFAGKALEAMAVKQGG